MAPTPLPIDAVLNQVVASLRDHPSLVISAPTGAGKTTRVPPAILDSGLAGDGQIVILEPRRLAARAAARRMAAERQVRLGDEVGYQVRFDRQCGSCTRILVLTEGLLVRMLQEDPFLEKVSVVVFDEFHERNLETDLALGMVRLIQQTVRPDLRLVVMSATLDTQAVALYLGNCPIVASEGRLHSIEINYAPWPAHETLSFAVAQGVEKLLERTAGDVLVFLPGLREIRQTASRLEHLAASRDLLVLPLHGDLPAEQQDAALLPQGRRKVVLATNVAETSVTVEGISGVVDTGLARVLVYDPRTGLDRLRLMPIARASADQRAGRAGRTGPGHCLRLWSEASHRSRPEQTEPEIRHVNLAGVVLQLLCWGESALDDFPWFEPPPAENVGRALDLLQTLGAVEAAGVTPLGRILARLPMHPRLGCLLVEGHRWGHGEEAALAAALLSERDPFSRADGGKQRSDTFSDVLDRMEELAAFERNGKSTPDLNHGAARFVLHARKQFQRLFERAIRGTHPSAPLQPVGLEEALSRSLVAAFPDRLARRRQPGSRKGVMVGGRGVRLAHSSGVLQPELFLCIDVDGGQMEALVRQASGVERDWLPAKAVTARIVALFDQETEKVIARKQIRYGDLILQEDPAALPDDAQVAKILQAAARLHWDRAVPTRDSPAGYLLARLRFLRRWLPDLHFPDFDDQALQDILEEVCHGCKSFADLHRAPWTVSLRNRLTPPQRQALDREAPESLLVPSGSLRPLLYQDGGPPLLAVRIQEIFGWRETPRLARGRVPVLLHLLAPSNRVEQITDDLASFWSNVYPRVRNALKIRYPKHAWPEDPMAARAERGPRPKHS